MSFRRKITSRQFLKGAAVAGGAMMVSGMPPFLRNAHAYAISPPLREFVDPMPLFGPDIRLAGTAGTPYTGVDYYTLTVGKFRQQLHSQLPAAGTALYGYADHTGNHKHLGGAVVANHGTPVRISLTSALPVDHILPYDLSIPSTGNGGLRKDRTAIHLHEQTILRLKARLYDLEHLEEAAPAAGGQDPLRYPYQATA